jgi:hypothetical protein
MAELAWWMQSKSASCIDPHTIKHARSAQLGVAGDFLECVLVLRNTSTQKITDGGRLDRFQQQLTDAERWQLMKCNHGAHPSSLDSSIPH